MIDNMWIVLLSNKFGLAITTLRPYVTQAGAQIHVIGKVSFKMGVTMIIIWSDISIVQYQIRAL